MESNNRQQVSCLPHNATWNVHESLVIAADDKEEESSNMRKETDCVRERWRGRWKLRPKCGRQVRNHNYMANFRGTTYRTHICFTFRFMDYDFWKAI
jgi:hypothetical protein